MIFITIAILFILIAEIWRYYSDKQSKNNKTKVRKNALPPSLKRRYTYVFVGSALLSLLTIWVYILNATVMETGPPFMVPWIIGVPICLVIFGVMAYSARAVIENLNIPRKLFVALKVVVILTILLSANVLLVAWQEGRLYLP